MFIIIVVCYNAGDKLKETLDSIKNQNYGNIDIIIKDGCSTDNSLEKLMDTGYFEDFGTKKIHIIQSPDGGIYNAMNQAVEEIKAWPESYTEGRYIYFLNCGDTLKNKDTLTQAASMIKPGKFIYYGKMYNRAEKSTIMPCPELREFDLYRNVPCHQVCFYSQELLTERQPAAFAEKYRVRADYEHFLFCCYNKKAKAVYINSIISEYEGRGFSETRENLKISKEEHKEITQKYMGNRAKLYKGIMIISLASIRSRLSSNPAIAPVYNSIKTRIYNILRIEKNEDTLGM